MLSDITVGQYFPGQSCIHRLDPRMKLVLSFGYILAIFIPKSWVGLAVAVAYLFGTMALSRVPLRMYFRGIKPILPLLLFTAILNVFYVDGKVLAAWWIFRITAEGLLTALFIVLRIVCLIAAGSVLTYTTSPTTLTDALENLLRPLRVIHVPVHEIAMMMTIALRFIPTLIEETEKILAAQKARGADFESGNLFRRAKALVPVLVPLFVSSFRRAAELATAMECRCYHGGEGRTRMKQYRLGAGDAVAASSFAILLAVLIVGNRLFPTVL